MVIKSFLVSPLSVIVYSFSNSNVLNFFAIICNGTPDEPTPSTFNPFSPKITSNSVDETSNLNVPTNLL